MSFISVKKEAFERAVAALTGQVMGGRTVVAELARGRGGAAAIHTHIDETTIAARAMQAH